MSMDQFVTTYRKDYLWPYIRAFGKKIIEPDPRGTGYDKKCYCRCYPPPGVSPSHHPPPEFDTEGQDWSRLGPMGPLLDPKLYPVKVGKSPETSTMRKDQPNAFLRKLREKYPYLYEVLQTHREDALYEKVNTDRLRSTYQVDYCKMEEIPPDELLRAAGVMGLSPCPEPVRLPGDPYPPQQKAISFRPALISKMGSCAGKTRGGRGGNGDDGGVVKFKVINTEYQDGISKLGSMIVRDKLHYHSKH